MAATFIPHQKTDVQPQSVATSVESGQFQATTLPSAFDDTLISAYPPSFRVYYLPLRNLKPNVMFNNLNSATARSSLRSLITPYDFNGYEVADTSFFQSVIRPRIEYELGSLLLRHEQGIDLQAAQMAIGDSIDITAGEFGGHELRFRLPNMEELLELAPGHSSGGIDILRLKHNGQIPQRIADWLLVEPARTRAYLTAIGSGAVASIIRPVILARDSAYLAQHGATMMRPGSSHPWRASLIRAFVLPQPLA